MKFSKKTGVLLAIAAAAIFSTSAWAQADGSGASSATVDCYGVNSCRGQGSCNTPTNSCQGLNSCKGKGVIKLSKSDCLKRGGTIMNQ